MSERVISQRKKAATSSFASPSLSSSTTPTLANPIRGFGLQADTVSQETDRESSNRQQEQPVNEQLSELEPFQQPLAHDISRISLRPQAKLTINQPGDPYEQEADWVAQRFMTMAAPRRSPSFGLPTTQDADTVQRKSVACEKE